MPLFVIIYAVGFAFFSYVLPKKIKMISRIIYAAGLSAFICMMFLVIVPKIATSNFLF